jgi:hypothetical protein
MIYRDHLFLRGELPMHPLYQTLFSATMLALLPAQDKLDSEGRAKAIAPYLDDQVIAVVYVDLARMDTDALLAKAAVLTKVDAGKLAAHALPQWLKGLSQAGAREVYFVVTMADLPHSPFLLVPLHKGADPTALRSYIKENEGKPDLFPAEVCEVTGDMLFAGRQSARERLRKLKAVDRPEVAKAFGAAGDAALQVVFLVTADTRRAIEDTLPQLPPEIGGGPVTDITRGIRWAALATDVKPKLSFRLTVQSGDAPAAQKLADRWAEALRLLAAHQEVRRLWPDFDRFTAKLRPKVEGDRLTLALDEPDLVALLQPAAGRARAAADRARGTNNLKQIGIALHNYHDAHKSFPAAASYDKNGKPLLSWRVHLLPYLDQDNLYKQFKLDEPWDSDHNKKLIEMMPGVFRSSERLPAGMTTYLGVAGEGAIFPDRKAVFVREIRGGT